MGEFLSRVGLPVQFERPDFETFAIFFLVFGYVIRIFNLSVRYLLGNIGKLDTLFLYGSLAFLFLLVAPDIVKRIRSWQILVILSEITLFAFFMLISSEVEHGIVLGRVLTQCIPMFIVGACIFNYNKIREGLTKVMTVVPYCYLLMMVLFGLNTLSEGFSYSQWDGYNMLFVTIVLTSALMERFSVKYLIPLVIGMFFMFAYGARGPLTCWALFVILQLVTSVNLKSSSPKMVVMSGLSVLGLIVYNWYYEILLWFKTFLSPMGFSNRVVDMMLNASFFTDKGRGSIADVCLERIWSNPFIGTGPVNDRIYINDHLGGWESAIGNYPHNIFLEFLLQYGVIIGGLLLVLMLWVIIKAYCVAPDISSKSFILILVGTYFFPLLFSGSYLDSRGFYLLMAVCISIVMNYRKRNVNGQGVQRFGDN